VLPLTKTRAKLARLASFGSGLFSIKEAALMTRTGEETIRRAIRADDSGVRQPWPPADQAQ
jgi:hypothetical protein